MGEPTKAVLLETPQQFRATAHKIADIIYEKLTGDAGVFSTRIAYVTKQGPRYQLQVLRPPLDTRRVLELGQEGLRINLGSFSSKAELVVNTCEHEHAHSDLINAFVLAGRGQRDDCLKMVFDPVIDFLKQGLLLSTKPPYVLQLSIKLPASSHKPLDYVDDGPAHNDELQRSGDVRRIIDVRLSRAGNEVHRNRDGCRRKI